MIGNTYLDNISVILHQPKFPENIGAAARAMCNMGLTHLIVVTNEKYDQEKIDKMATHVAADIISNTKYIDSLEEAVSPFGYIVGMTARSGKNRQSSNLPGKVAAEIVSASKENLVGLLFGPEDKGLSSSA